jgi:hypothetical protein
MARPDWNYPGKGQQPGPRMGSPSRCEAADRTIHWVSVSVADMVGILRCCGATSRRHYRSPASASSRRGRIPDKQSPQDDDTTARFAAECQSFLRPSSMPCLWAPDSELAGWGLITAWLPVRVLPAPPRSPALTPSSPSPRNTLDFSRDLGRV